MIGVVAVFLFVTITAGILFAVLKAAHGLRVTEEEEFAGLDVKEHGAPGYGGFIFEREEITVEEETTEKVPVLPVRCRQRTAAPPGPAAARTRESGMNISDTV